MINPDDIVLDAEVLVDGFGLSRRGARGTVLMDRDHFDDWMMLDKSRVRMILIRVVDEEPKDEPTPEKGPFGAIVKDLHLAGWFRNPKVVAAAECVMWMTYTQWIQRQPCAVCGGGEWVEKEAKRFCQQAHIRRAGHDGTAYKGDYQSIPLCHQHHIVEQSQHGESEILKQMSGWFMKQDDPLVALAVRYREEYCKQAFREYFDVGSLTAVMPSNWIKFAEDHDLTVYLPKSFLADVEI